MEGRKIVGKVYSGRKGHILSLTLFRILPHFYNNKQGGFLVSFTTA